MPVTATQEKQSFCKKFFQERIKNRTFVLCDKRSNKLPSQQSEFIRTDSLFT